MRSIVELQSQQCGQLEWVVEQQISYRLRRLRYDAQTSRRTGASNAGTWRRFDSTQGDDATRRSNIWHSARVVYRLWQALDASQQEGVYADSICVMQHRIDQEVEMYFFRFERQLSNYCIIICFLVCDTYPCSSNSLSDIIDSVILSYASEVFVCGNCIQVSFDSAAKLYTSCALCVL